MVVQPITLKNELNDNQLAVTLKNSLYPDASGEAIQMVLSYCKALKLDPMMKPVHIVKYGDKEVLMPGIGLYRTQALRSGAYAGLSEPEFGRLVTEKFKKPIVKWNRIKKSDGTFYNKREVTGHEDVEVSYPEWCKITARKLLQGKIVELTAVEYWKENYATCGKDSDFPNDMWLKRARGQLAKCTEAQALRKMFPEFVPQQPTFEEMEGKHFEESEVIEHSVSNVEHSKPVSSIDSVKQKLKCKFSVERPVEVVQQPVSTMQAEPQSVEPVQLKVKEETKNHLKFLAGYCQVPQKRISSWFKKIGLTENSWDDFTEQQAAYLISTLESENLDSKQAWLDFAQARVSYNQQQPEGVSVNG